jgi:hypothetical protein
MNELFLEASPDTALMEQRIARLRNLEYLSALQSAGSLLAVIAFGRYAVNCVEAKELVPAAINSLATSFCGYTAYVGARNAKRQERYVAALEAEYRI